jgi:hypothetical protein
MSSAGFLVEPQNQGQRFVRGLAWKPLGQVFWFGPQNDSYSLAISWFGPKNQAIYGLSVAPQNQREDEDGAGHASRSSGLLHLKIGGGATRIVHVASSWRLCWVEAKDGQVDAMGCIGPFYLNFIVFTVLGIRGILVF